MARTKQTARKSTGGKAPRGVLPTPLTAFDMAWTIPEIAERILSHLPMKDLLLVQRVSTEWKALIENSPKLQILLFMRPKRVTGVQATHPDGTPIREFNPLLCDHMSFWFLTGERAGHRSVEDISWAKTGARLAYMRRDASWRKMLVAQPPFTTFESVHNTHYYGGDGLSAGCIKVEDGVRMGLVYDQTVRPDLEGHRSLPVDFYTLLDGRTTLEPELVDDKDGGKDEPRQRLFGGCGVFTLFWQTTRGCTPNWGGGVQALQLRTFISTGSVDVSIARSVLSGGRGYSWWTENGYLTS